MMSVTELMQSRRARHALERLNERYGVVFDASQIDWICHQIQTPHESDRDFKLVARGIDDKELWKVNIGLLLQDDLWIFCVYDRIRNQVVTILSREQGRTTARRMRNHRLRMEKRRRRMKIHSEHNRRVLEEFWLKTGRAISWPIDVLCN
jgi:hypothetical protein